MSVLEEIRRKAQAGDAKEQADLGDLYQEGGTFAGEHVPKDHALALHWYGKSAEQNNAYGLLKLGLMIERGVGCEPDLSRARELFIRAATIGQPHLTDVGASLSLIRLGLSVAAGHAYVQEAMRLPSASRRQLLESYLNRGAGKSSGGGSGCAIVLFALGFASAGWIVSVIA